MQHLQLYITTFELYYRNFEPLPQIHQISTILNSKIEEVFETPETADVETSTAHYMIESIVNPNFGNKFHHQNGPNQRQNIHKTLVKIINPDSIKYKVTNKLHT